MTLLSSHEITAEFLPPAGPTVDLSVIEHNVTLDDGWTPYGQALLVCTIPSTAVVDALDPRNGAQPRVRIRLTQRFDDWNSSGYRSPVTRALNLVVVDRELDHFAGTLTLSLETDEALLRNYGLGDVESQQSYGLNVREAVDMVLARINTTLQPDSVQYGMLTPDDKTHLLATNQVTNPNGTNGTGWGAAGLTVQYAMAPSAAAAIFTQPVGVNGGALVVPVLSLVRRTYRARIVIYQYAGTPYTGAMKVFARNTAGVQVGPEVTFEESGVWASGKMWAAEWSFTNPSNSPVNALRVQFSGVGTGAQFRMQSPPFVKETVSTTPLPASFAGDTPSNETYTYAWTGAAYQSPSTKTGAAGTGNDATVWEPDVTAWDYLTPLLQATNLRLYCDELRGWHLEDSDTPKDGSIRLLAGTNITKATDTVSFKDESSTYTGVLIRYRDDENGKPVCVFAGTRERVLILRYDRPSPGPNAAANVLARAQGRGRVFELESLNDYTADPGMALVAALPNTPTQTGVVTSVTWSGPDPKMRIASRSLVSTPPKAWLLASGSWAAAPRTWATY